MPDMEQNSADGAVDFHKQRGRYARWRTHLAHDANKEHADIILLISCFISGLVDSAVFNVWSCFVSMQTGNTVYVGLGMSAQPASQPYRWVKSGTAILSFCVGTYVFSRACRFIGPLRRITLCGSFIIQALLTFLAALLVVSGAVPSNAGNLIPKDYIVLLPLSLLSFQSAGQIVMSRMLLYNEIPTIVLTSTYCDLMFDPYLFTAPITQNAKRNRRFLSAIALVLGAGLGGLLTRKGDIADPLWIAGGVKVVLAGTWLLWRAEAMIRLD